VSVPAKVRRSDLPQEYQELLQSIESHARKVEWAMTVWNRYFTEAERKELGGDPYEAWKRNGGTVGMWAVVREVSRDRAAVDIAYALDWVDTRTCGKLLEAIGEKQASAITPRWIKRSGELWYDGEVIRKVANQAKAKNIVAILDACEESNWPQSFADPVTSGGDSGQRRRTIESLNKGLKRIKFACGGDGESFTWAVVPKASPKKPTAKSRRRNQS
jgi:hypothetical protein